MVGAGQVLEEAGAVVFSPRYPGDGSNLRPTTCGLSIESQWTPQTLSLRRVGNQKRFGRSTRRGVPVGSPLGTA